MRNAEVRPAQRRAHERSDVDEEVLQLVDGLTATIIAIARLWRRGITREFNPTELILLGAIRRNGPISLAELAVLEGVSAPTVSRVVRSLEVRCLVERLGTSDRRVSLVRLTHRGAKIQVGLFADINAELADRLENLSVEQRTLLEQAVPILDLLLATGDERER
jgi:DNA-binding MarR family transcriptional regulator